MKLISELLFIVDNLNVRNESSMIYFVFRSNEDFLNAIRRGKTLKEFLDFCEFSFQGSFCSDNFKILLRNIKNKVFFYLTEIFPIALDLDRTRWRNMWPF